MMELLKTETRGGSRPGAGRPKADQTTLKSFRINSEALEICLDAYGKNLSAMLNSYIKKLAAAAIKKSL